MQATVVTVSDPFHPMRGRSVRVLDRPARLMDLAPDTNLPFVCIRNGQAVLRKDWRESVTDADLVAFVTLPQGGGGGSNPLRLLLMIAVVALAPWASAGIVAGLNTTLGIAGMTALTAGVTAAGMVLVNALIPPPKPQQFSAASMPAASPTYNLQAQGNAARLESPIPVHYGRLKFWPDFASLPYAEYDGNEQYLFQLFTLGQGYYDLEAIQIEDTPIDSWEDITYEVIEPGGTLSLFPSNVVTNGEVAGQEAIYDTYLGPFVANASDTDANYLGVDVVFPSGLFYYDTNGIINNQTVTFTVEAIEITDLGVDVGAYFTLGSESVTAGTTTPQRYSYRYSVTAARYKVRLKRTSNNPSTTGYSTTMVWAGLRAYLPETRDFGNVTLLAMRMRASNNLSIQSSRKINCIATRKLKSWHPVDGWAASYTATRSIAWALADMLKNADYGGGLADARIDLQGLYDLQTTWTARGDTLDGRFDSADVLWSALTTASIAGRAKPYIQGSIVHFARDEDVAFPVAMFSMRNIVKGSFGIDYLMTTEETADAVEVSYFSDVSWTPQRVTAYLPGSTAAKPAKLNLFGVTDREHAYREGMYFAAANRYRRKIIRFATEMEGFIPSYGDLIAVQHDMPQWGQFAECTAWNAGTLTLTVSEPMVFDTGTHYIGIRTKNGGMEGPIVVTAGATAYELVLAESPAYEPYTGIDYERTQITFGWGETWRQEARVIAVRPRGLEQVEIECINEDPSVHTADSGITAPAVNSSQLSTLYTAPVIAGLTAASNPSDVEIVMLSWQPSAGAEYYIIEQSSDSTDWSRVAETRANNFTFRALYGNATIMRVAAVGLTRGAWVTVAYGSSADYMWDANTATLMWSVTDTDLMWR